LTEHATHRLSVLVVNDTDVHLEDLPSTVTDRYSVRLVSDEQYLEKTIDSSQPEVVVIETDLPDQRDITAVEHVWVYSPTTAVLARTPKPPAHARVALATRAGADGFIDSAAGPEGFIAVVGALHIAIDEVACSGTEPTRNATPEEYDMNSYMVETGGYG
jgi:DNA-binding NarL/FixJ family response regulator